jgi:plasmid stabilization system protein ParE
LAAAGQVARIVKAVATLPEFPQSGRPGRRAGTRELVVAKTPFVVAYRVRGDLVEILRVLHGARRWPRF